MPRLTDLDKRWDDLMGLCRKEAEFEQQGRHPKVRRFVGKAIDELARELGFKERQIAAREFRAERDGGHIVRLITEG
jgi:AraC-like DNA-binding protein